MQQLQHEDPVKRQKLKPTNKEKGAQPAHVKKFLRHWQRLKIIGNILYSESGENLQLVLPSKLHKLGYEVYTFCHKNL